MTDDDLGPRCSRSKEERWAQIMRHCLGPPAGGGLKELSSRATRWATILRRARRPVRPVRDEADVAERLATVERNARSGDDLAVFVVAVARLLSVDLEGVESPADARAASEEVPR